MATLTVVMILFFVLAMVAAYTNRNLVFEQRTSANSYFSAQALAAAEAGIDWTIAMLNGGIVDETCQPGGAATNDFRTRYLNPRPDGAFIMAQWPAAAGAQTPRPSCTMTETGWICGCPSGPVATLPGASSAEAPVVFSVALSGKPNQYAPDANPGVVQLTVKGCTSAITGDVTAGNVNSPLACHIRSSNQSADVDGQVTVRTTLALVSALPVPPAATLTAGSSITLAPGITLNASNMDPQTGQVLHAGGGIVKGTGAIANLRGPAGNASGALEQENDTTLFTAASSAGEELFQSVFGMARADYRNQPGALRINCAGACSLSAQIAPVLALNPSRVVWVEGDLNVDVNGPLGDAGHPAVIVVNGNVTYTQPTALTGVIYSHGNLTWEAGASTAVVTGALLVRGSFTANANAAMVYDGKVIRRVLQGYGSFVRVPGSWTAS